MSHKSKIIIAMIVIGLGFLIVLGAGGAAWWLLRGRTDGFSLPPQLPAGIKAEDLATRYPQIATLLRDPKVGSAIKDFIIAYNSGGPEAAKSYARDSGFMNADDDITLRLLTTTDDTAQLERELSALKVQIVSKAERELNVLIPWAVVQANIAAGHTPDTIINSISKINTVRAILPIEPYRPNNILTELNITAANAVTYRPLSASGSEGVNKTGADRWHKAGFTGKGVKIGILDPEVSKADQFIGRVLPTNTKVRKTGCVTASGRADDGNGTHGLAAAEIIHEMAPDAELFIACGKDSSSWYASIDWLVSNGVKIISHSAGGVYGPRNGEGINQRKIDELTRRGILWVNAAGNEANKFHRGRLSGASSDYTHEFAPNKTALGVRASGRAMLIKFIWNEWESSLPSDYDIFLFDGNGNQIARSDDDNQQTGNPDEYFFAGGLTSGQIYYLRIQGSGKTLQATYLIHIQGAAAIELPTTAGSLGAPGDAKGSLTVGAVNWQTDEITDYSSRGPTEDGRLKPEISAPTEVSNQIAQGAGSPNFNGTSAAAPHVSGAAALLWGANPKLSRDEVVAFLLNRSRDLGPRGADMAYGYGRLDLGDPPQPPATAIPTLVPSPTAVPPTLAPRVTATAIPPTPPPTAIAPTATAALPTPPVRATPVPAPTQPSPSNDFSWGAILGVGGLGVMGGVLLTIGSMMLWRLIHAKPNTPALPPIKTQRAGVCPHCNAPMPPTARFCGKCGRRT